MSRRAFAIVALTAAITVATVVPVAAHVSWRPSEAPTGAPAELVLRVPNERDDAATTAVELVFPDDHQLRGVEAAPPAGWEARVDGDPVERITWTATAGGIGGEERVELPVSIAGVHGAGGGERLVFKALQTYDSGEVVRWIDEPVAGGAEPEHPAPVLTLTGPASAAPDVAAPGDDPVVAAPTTDVSAPAATAPPGADGDGDDGDGPPLLLLLGLFVAAMAVTVAVVVRRGGRAGA